MENLSPAASGRDGVAAILVALEQQLAALDCIGAHVAAAHCDATIQQLRRDLARQATGLTAGFEGAA